MKMLGSRRQVQMPRRCRSQEAVKKKDAEAACQDWEARIEVLEEANAVQYSDPLIHLSM